MISPNPVRETILITYNLAESGSHRIIANDIFGRELFDISIDSDDQQVLEREINTSGYNSGIYFLRIETHSQVLVSLFEIVK